MKQPPRSTPGSASAPSKAPASLRAPRPLAPTVPIPSKAPLSVPQPTSRPPTPPRTPLDPAALDGVDVLARLEAEARARFAAAAVVETLAADEEVAGFGVALLLDGDAAVCAAIVDTPVSGAALGALLPARGTFGDAVALRVVAGARGARVAVWNPPAVEAALAGHPEVIGALSARADRLQALAGATLGPLGELSDAARERLVERLGIRVVQPARGGRRGGRRSRAPDARVRRLGRDRRRRGDGHRAHGRSALRARHGRGAACPGDRACGRDGRDPARGRSRALARASTGPSS